MVAEGQFDDDIDDDIDAPWRRPGRDDVATVESARGSSEQSTTGWVDQADDPARSAWARNAAGDAPGIPVSDVDRSSDDPTPVTIRSSAASSASADSAERETEPVRPRTRSSRQIVAVAVGVLVLALVVMIGAVTWLRNGESTLAPSAAPVLPSAAMIVWTSQFDGDIESTAVGEGLVVVATSDGLTALAEDDGEVVWRRVHSADAGDIERVAVMGQHVVVTQLDAIGTTNVRAFDRGNGTEVWRTGGDDGTYTIVGPNSDPMIVGRTRVDDGTMLAFIDPVDGSTQGDPVRLSAVAIVGGGHGVEPVDRRVAIWSTDDDDFVTAPVDAFNLRAVAPLDGAVVALDLDGRIVAFDDAGRRTDELVLLAATDDGGDAVGRVELAGIVAEAGVGIIAGESSLGFTVRDGLIETVWRRTGRVTGPVSTSRGELSVLFVPDEGSGEIGEVVIDSADGSTVTPIDSSGRRERISTLAHNGYLVAPTVGAVERVLTAFGYDGALLWSLPIAPEADYEAVGGVVLIVENTSDGGTVGVAR